MTRDNMLEGDTGASGLARRLKRTVNPPAPLRIRIPAYVGSNFEGLVVRVDGHLWKLVRTFDDPGTWTEPGVRHLAANGLGREAYRTSPLDDQWELYDLSSTRPKPSTAGRIRTCTNCVRTCGCSSKQVRAEFRARAKSAVALCISPAASLVEGSSEVPAFLSPQRPTCHMRHPGVESGFLSTSLGNRTKALVSVLGTWGEFLTPHNGAQPQRSQRQSQLSL